MPIEPPIQGMKKTPAFIGDPVMGGAWYGLILWAASQDEFLCKFQEDTGHDLKSLFKVSGLERMIDQATGYDRAVVAAWADWVTENLWGEWEG